MDVMAKKRKKPAKPQKKLGRPRSWPGDPAEPVQRTILLPPSIWELVDQERSAEVTLSSTAALIALISTDAGVRRLRRAIAQARGERK